MECELEVLVEEVFDIRYHLFKCAFIFRKDDEVICIADIALCLDPMLHILVKLVHVDIYQKL